MYKIMIIDDSVMNLSVAKSALDDTYDVVPIPSGVKALEVLHRGKSLPDLILLDLNMPEISGFEVIQELKKTRLLSEIPVIFLTTQDDEENELQGLSLGAVDYVKKPFSPPLLKKRIAVNIQLCEQTRKLAEYNETLEERVNAKTKQILEQQNAIIAVVVDLIGKRDGFTGRHIRRVQRLFRILLKEAIDQNAAGNITAALIEDLAMVSQLHDVGKIGIVDSVLLKPGRLNPNEVEAIRQHTTMGAESIAKALSGYERNQVMIHALQMVKSHHEKWDGSGYPEGLSGYDIPLVARVLASVDVFEAITSDRPYRTPMPHSEVVDYIKSLRGSHFDPALVDVFLQCEQKLVDVI